MRLRVVLVSIFVIFLISCQAAPASRPISSPQPSPTPLPSATATLSPTASQTAVPAPTVSPAELKRRAGPICENAFSALVESGPLETPFAVLKKMSYTDAPAWEISHQLPHLNSFSAAEVQTVFCISETRTQTGTYTDGSAAHQIFWDVRAVSWPGGRVIGRHSFAGSSPDTNVPSSDSAEGAFPYKEFAAWIFNQIEHPEFLYFSNAITSLATSPDGRLAAFGTAIVNQIVDRDYQARIFLFDPSDLQTDMGTSSFLNVLDGHQGMVTSLGFSPDGNTLASSGYDRFIKFWDVRNGNLVGQVALADTPNILLFSSDGSKLVVGSNLEVTFINPDSLQIEKSIPMSGGEQLALSSDGNLIYVSTPFRMTVIDVRASAVILEFPDPSTLVSTLTVADDGSVLSVTYETPNTIDNFVLSPDGTEIITYTVDRSIDSGSGLENVRLATWEAATGKYLGETKFVSDFLSAMKISPDGKLLAIGNSNEVWIWDTASWQLIKRFSGHIDAVEDLVFTPDGTNVLSAGRDGTIRVWSLEE